MPGSFILLGALVTAPCAPVLTRFHPRRDVVDAHDSITVVLYHVDMKSMLLVRQFRPALYASLMRAAEKEGKSVDVPLVEGFTCELCAGLVDKDKAMEEIVKEEILEECALHRLRCCNTCWKVNFCCSHKLLHFASQMIRWFAGVGMMCLSKV
jgi:hypothetical protein